MGWFRIAMIGALSLLFSAIATVVHAEAASGEVPNEPSTQAAPIFYISQVWPWGYADSEGNPAGMLAEFARRLAVVADVPLQIELRPHRRVIAELESGRSEFITLFKADVPPGSTIDLGPVTTTKILLTNDGLDTSDRFSMDSISNQSIAFINGTSYGPEFDDRDDIRRIPVRDLFQAVELLRKDRIDGFISSGQALHHTLKAMSLAASDFNINETGRTRVAHLYMARTATWPRTAEKLRAALDRMRSDGELADIFALPHHRYPE